MGCLFIDNYTIMFYLNCMIKETQNGILATIKISPNAKKNEIIKTDKEEKIKLTAQPIEGKANK